MPTEVLDPALMRVAAEDVADKLKILANPDRLLLLCQLSQGERCVGDLEEVLDIRPPTLSQQLRVLRHEGVVRTRRSGKYINYSVADQQLLQVLTLLYELYCPKENRP
jgi:ArsR family transcriptional regulator